MGRWEWPAYVGILGGVGLFALIWLPAVITQYRRYGTMSAGRLAGVAGISIYIVALAAYTLLPLPPRTDAWCAAHGYESANLKPFQFVADVREATAGMGLRDTLLSFAVLQVVFNVLLFIPFGVFVRRFFGRGIAVATLAGLATSILIETTQYTGIFGIYGCSYRYADVDDLMANTLGAFIGASLAWVVLGWMPQSERLARHRLEARPVTRRRRFLGMLIDVSVSVGLGVGLIVVYRLGRYVIDPTYVPPEDSTRIEALVQYLVPALLVSYLPALIRRGASLGQRIVWLAPYWPNGATGVATLWRRLLRATVPGGAVALLSLWSSISDRFALASDLAWGGLIVAAVVSVFITPDGLSYRLAGGRVIDARGTGPSSGATVPPN